MPTFDLSVVGELNLDLILSGLPPIIELDREHLAKDLTITLGSSSAIFAHNFASLGNKVGFSSSIGSDQLGQICIERLGASGVDLSRVRKFSGKLTGLTVILPQQNKRYILTYPGTMFDMTYEDLDLPYIFSAKHFHLSSYFLHRALRPRIAELFREAQHAGLTTSLDTNDDPEDAWAEDLLQVLPYVDVLLPNEQESCRMSRKNTAEEAADFLAAKVPLVVIKCGSKGVLARRGSETFTALPQKLEAVDSVGAGDSFDAGFLHKFIRGAAIEECLAYGNLTGALSVTRAGGTEAFRDTQHRENFLASRSKA